MDSPPPRPAATRAPTRVRAIISSWQPGALTAPSRALTGLRVGLHWVLPAMLVFTLGLGAGEIAGRGTVVWFW